MLVISCDMTQSGPLIGLFIDCSERDRLASPTVYKVSICSVTRICKIVS